MDVRLRVWAVCAHDREQLRGATALYIAAQNGHPSCVKLLLDAGAEVDPKMADDGTGAHALCIGSAPDAIACVIDCLLKAPRQLHVLICVVALVSAW